MLTLHTKPEKSARLTQPNAQDPVRLQCTEPLRNREQSLDLGQNYMWEAVSAFPGLMETPKAWDTYSANVLTNPMQMEQSRYDGCLFYRFEPSREQVEEKAGRHIDDFLVTGYESNVERFLAQAKDKLNMQDAVRLYKKGDEGRLLAVNLRKLENGYALQDKPFLIHENATAFDMENTKSSPIPESISHKPQDDDDQPLTPSDARTFKTCVGKAMYLSHHRPDIQHSVDTLSRSMRNNTITAMQKLKKLTHYLLGTSDVYHEKQDRCFRRNRRFGSNTTFEIHRARLRYVNDEDVAE